MNVKQKIEEWRRGCSNAPEDPWQCRECTEALIEAIERDCNGFPIHTAPHDKRVLLWNPRHEEWCTGWVEDFSIPPEEPEIVHIWDREEWDRDRATHWAPLPGTPR